jgi:hypothetical protein
MLENEIYLEITKKLERCKNNPKTKKILLPEYIYEDQEEVIIYNTKPVKQSKSPKNPNKIMDKTTYILDCSKGRKEYLDAFRNKTLVVPSGMHYLIIIKYEYLECYLDLSGAMDLEYLELCCPDISLRSGKQITKWAPNLKYLILDDYDYPLDNLPSGLEYLCLPDKYNHPLDNLPSSLIGFVFPALNGTYYDYSFDNLPYGIKYIELGDITFGDDVINPYDNLPSTLEILNFDYIEVNYPLNNLPDNLKYLKLGSCSQPIIKLPLELKILDITHGYWTPCDSLSKYLSNTVFPPKFEKVNIFSYNYKIHKPELQKLKNLLVNIKIEITDNKGYWCMI